MSECVVRMEMPKNGCSECRLKYKKRGYGGIFYCFNHLCVDKWTYGRTQNGDRPSWCPILCQLPEGHGDLVDWRDIENELDRTFRVIVDDGPCAGSYIREYPQSLIEQPIRVRIIVPADTAERSEK